MEPDGLLVLATYIHWDVKKKKKKKTQEKKLPIYSKSAGYMLPY